MSFRGDATWHSESRWLDFLNGAGETISAYAAMRISSVDNTTGRITTAKPNANNQLVYFNGPWDVASGGVGICTRDWPAWALYDTGDGTPAAGDEWGAEASSWKLNIGRTGYKIIGGATGGRVLVEQNGDGSGAGAFGKILEADSLPDGSGYYDARLQVSNADGTLADTGASVWMREAQDMGRLFYGTIYPVKRTGYANSRDVYTVADYALIVANESYGVYVPYTNVIEFRPDAAWDLAVHETVARAIVVKRKLDVYEGADLKMENTKKLVFKSSSDILEDDFDLTAGSASSGDIDEIALAGESISFDVLVACENGQLKKRNLTFRRGSLKVVGGITGEG